MKVPPPPPFFHLLTLKPSIHRSSGLEKVLTSRHRALEQTLGWQIITIQNTHSIFLQHCWFFYRPQEIHVANISLGFGHAPKCMIMVHT